MQDDPSPHSPLRLGLLLDSPQLPAWSLELLRRIQREGHAQLALLILRAPSPSPPPPRAPLQRLRARAATAARALYERLDARAAAEPDAFALGDADALFAGVPTLSVTPVETRFSDRLHPDDVQAIRAHDLDVIVRLGFRILRGEILRAARYGVWSYHHGDNRVNRGGPAGFWEVMRGEEETGATLQVLGEELDNGLVLERWQTATHPLSARVNRNGLYWGASSMLPRQLARLRQQGPARYFAAVEAAQEPLRLYDRRLYTTASLGNAQMAGYLARLQARRLRQGARRRLWREQWQLRYGFGEAPATSLWRLKALAPPPDRFWADPHILRHEGDWYIFCEEFLYAPWRGRIAWLRLGPDGLLEPPGVALEAPHHLSYPFVFTWEGVHYMVPESASIRRVELYACCSFPGVWERRAVLLEGVHAVDATLLRRDGRWWLFANLVEAPGASSWDALHLFSREDLFSGEWEPHPLNPIVSGVGRARPAGRLFERGGRLYRPSQRCTPRYGYGFQLNEVEVLTRTDYREREVTRAEPRWEDGLRGTHTYSYVEGLTVIDALRASPREDLPAWLRRAL
jgi:folate-dependent phosphoribosylglycinamide formyltransferase PurN